MRENKQTIKTLADQIPATVYSNVVDVRNEDYVIIETQLTALGAGGSVALTLESTTDDTNWSEVTAAVPAYDPTDIGNHISFSEAAVDFLEKVRVKIVVAGANASLILNIVMKASEAR
jgi:hypothetical protein